MSRHLTNWVLGLGAGLLVAGAVQAEQLKIAYMPNPIQEASVAMLEKWGKANGVDIVKVPMAYNVYMEKVTATLTSGGDQFDVIWHNDDWGQLWKKWLEPVNQKQILDLADHWAIDIPFRNDDGQNTVVPMAHTFGVFWYRTDLVKTPPKTWDEMVKISQQLQKDGKVKYGYVGGMAMNHTWFSWLWSMWTNECDVMMPIFSRENAELEKSGWNPAIDQACMTEVVEFWHDAINKHQIAPKGMPAYGRSEANAIFMAGDAAFTVVDSVHWGEFNDPAKSKIVGKVAMAKFPLGPRRKADFAWNDIWGWAIPKGVPAARKDLAKKMLLAMMEDKDGQVAMWKATGGPPPNRNLWGELAKTDKVMQMLKEVSLDVPPPTHGAYYFAKWPAVHKAFSDTVIKAVTGPREDIAKVLKEGKPYIAEAAKP